LTASVLSGLQDRIFYDGADVARAALVERLGR
jgi:hypothetical protein